MGASFFNGNFLKVLPTKGIELKDGTRIITGTGSPEGVETAPIGSWYTDTSNGDWYRKLSGTGNTGWVANTFNLLQDGSLSLPSLAFASNTGSGMFYVDTSTGLLWLTTDGKKRLGIGPSSTDVYAQTEELVAQFTTLGSTFPYGIYAPGAIVQSVYSSNSYQTSTTGTTYTDILSALGVTWEIAITPKSASSVIDLMANFQYLLSRNTDSNGGGILVQRKIGAGAYSTIYTPLSDGTGPFEIRTLAGGSVNISQRGKHQIVLRDSPATTSIVTYKFQFRNRDSTSSPSFIINEDSTTDGQSFVILNEVAA